MSLVVGVTSTILDFMLRKVIEYWYYLYMLNHTCPW